MAVNFLVAFRVAEFAATPLRRISDATVRLAGNAALLSSQARAANASLLAIGVAANAALGAMAVSASQVEDAIARLETATETTTTSVTTALENAKAAATKFSQEYSADVETIIKAQFRLATAGVPVKEQIDAVQGAYKLAIATMGDFTVAAELLGSFLNTFGNTQELSFLAPMEKVEKITDIASAAVQKYQLDLNNLNDSLKFLVGPATTLGLPIAEVFGFAGALNTAGFRGTLAGTAISNAFNKIDNAIEKLGLDPTAFTDVSGNLTDFATFLDEVERATAGMTSIERQSKFIEVFDIRAGRAINTLIQMKDGVREFVAQADVAVGTTDKLAQVIESTTSSQFKQLGNVLANTSAVIGQNVNDAIKSVMPSLKTAAISMYEFAAANSKSIAAIIGIVGITLAASAAIITYGLVVMQTSNALAQLAATSAAASYAVAALRGVMFFAGIAVGITAVVAGLALIINAVKSVKDIFNENATAGERFVAVILTLTSAAAGFMILMVGWRMIRSTIVTLIASVGQLTAAIGLSNGAAVMLGRSLLYAGISFGAVIAGISAVQALSRAFEEGASSSQRFAAIAEAILMAVVAAAQLRILLAGISTLMASSGFVSIWRSIYTAIFNAYIALGNFATRILSVTALVAGLALVAASVYFGAIAFDALKVALDDTLSASERLQGATQAIVPLLVSITFAVAGLRTAWISLGVANQAVIASWLTTAWGAVAAGLSTIWAALVAVTGAFWSAAAAALGFQAVTAPIWAVIAVALAAVALVAWGIYEAYNAITASSEKLEDSTKLVNDQFKVNQKQIGDSLTLTAKYANELDRLSKITKGKLRVRVRTDGEPLGDLPIAREASNKLLTDPSLPAFKALNQSIQSIDPTKNPVVELLKQVEEYSNRGGLVKLYDDFNNLFESINPTYASLDAFGRAAYVARIGADANSLALLGMANNSKEAAEALQILLGAIAKVDAGKFLSPEESKAVFEALDKQSVAFSESSTQSVRSLGEQFMALKARVKDLSSSSDEFGQMMNLAIQTGIGSLDQIKTDFVEVARSAQDLIARNKALEISFSRFRNAGGAIKNMFKGAEVGATDYASVLPQAEQKLREQMQALADIKSQIEKNKAAFEKLKLVPQLQGTEQLKDLEVWIAENSDKVITVQVELAESSLAVASNRFNQVIRKMSVVEADVFKGLADAIKGPVSEGFNKGFSAAATVSGIVDAMRSELTGKLSEKISMGLAQNFSSEMTEVQMKMEEFLMSVTKEKRLDIMINNGSLVAELENVMKSASPRIASLLNGSLSSGVNQLRKSLLDVYDEAAVNIFTASAESGAALTELQKIISRPVTSLSDMQAQVDELGKLLVNAYTNGADAAVGPIENALKMLMTQVREQGGGTPVDKFVTAAQQAEISLTNVATTFANTFNEASISLGRGAEPLIKAIAEIKAVSEFDRLSQTFSILSNALANAKATGDNETVQSLEEMLKALQTARREIGTGITPVADGKSIAIAGKQAADGFTSSAIPSVAEVVSSLGNASVALRNSAANASKQLVQSGADLVALVGAGFTDASNKIIGAGESIRKAVSEVSAKLSGSISELGPATANFAETVSLGINAMLDNIALAQLTQDVSPVGFDANGIDSAMSALASMQQAVTDIKINETQLISQIEAISIAVVDAFTNGGNIAFERIATASDYLVNAATEAGAALSNAIQSAKDSTVSVAPTADATAAIGNVEVDTAGMADAVQAASGMSKYDQQYVNDNGFEAFIRDMKLNTADLGKYDEQYMQANGFDAWMRDLQNSLSNRNLSPGGASPTEFAQPVQIPTVPPAIDFGAGVDAAASITGAIGPATASLTQAGIDLGQSLNSSSTLVAAQITDAGQALRVNLSEAASEFSTALRDLIPTANDFNVAIASGIKDLIENIKQVRDKAEDEIKSQATGDKSVEINLNNQPQNINIQLQQGAGSSSNTNRLDEYDVRKIVEAATTALNSNVREAIRQLEERLRRR